VYICKNPNIGFFSRFLHSEKSAYFHQFKEYLRRFTVPARARKTGGRPLFSGLPHTFI